MTQQLSLFDLGDPVQPEPKKKTTGKRVIEDNAVMDNVVENVAAPIVQQEEKGLSPMQFYFFVADDVVPVIKETVTAEEIKRDVEIIQQEEIISFDEDIAEETSPEEIITEKEQEEFTGEEMPQAATYQPDEKIKIVRKRGRKSFKEIDAEVDLISIPEDEELFKKQYYSITEVAKWFRVNNSLLRFWENEFPVLKPRKNKKGDRLFRPEDVKNLQVIYYLLRQRKFTIDGARKYMKAHKENIEVNLKLIQSLNKFKGFLLELKANAEK